MIPACGLVSDLKSDTGRSGVVRLVSDLKSDTGRSGVVRLVSDLKSDTGRSGVVRLVSDFKSDTAPALSGHWYSCLATVMLDRMGRPSREEGGDAIHHVIPRGNGCERIVHDDRDRHAYVVRFARIRRELGWLSPASCLLDTHHHAIVETSEPNLGLGMRRLLGGHSHWMNVRHGRKGSLFTPHFWSRRIHDDAWLFRACIYIVLNPVAAGVCVHPADWSWCSYRVTAEGDPDAYAPGEERLLRMFGSTPSEARRCYARVVQEGVDNILGERALSSKALWQELRSLEPPSPRVSD